MIRPCGSHTRRSTRLCSSRAGVLCDVSLPLACAPVAHSAFQERAPVHAPRASSLTRFSSASAPLKPTTVPYLAIGRATSFSALIAPPSVPLSNGPLHDAAAPASHGGARWTQNQERPAARRPRRRGGQGRDRLHHHQVT